MLSRFKWYRKRRKGFWVLSERLNIFLIIIKKWERSEVPYSYSDDALKVEDYTQN